MEWLTDIVDGFSSNWAEWGVVFLLFHQFLKGLRDAIDKTPETDDNWFEKTVTVLGKATSYFATGKRTK